MAPSQSIGQRITWYEKDQNLYLTISGRLESWKETMLMVWLLAWTICGSAVLGQLLLEENSRDNSIFLVIYLSFWAYFEVRIGRAFLWRKYGNERIRIGEGKLLYKREIRSFGKAKTFLVENINKFQSIEHGERSFAKAFGKSFWVVGGETLEFQYMGSAVRLAMQLEEEEAKALFQLLRKQFRQQSKS